jgi:ABC-type polysaccharide/polyol phosphate export permease
VRDVRLFTEVALMLGFYLTPVFYRRDALPSSVSFFYDWNPVARLLGAYRDILIYHRMPEPGSMLVVTGAALVCFAIGSFVYRRTSMFFLDEL